jgi:hypothetical protein
MRLITAIMTAMEEGMIFASSRLIPTSVNPKFVGKNNRIEVIKPTMLQAPIT